MIFDVESMEKVSSLNQNQLIFECIDNSYCYGKNGDIFAIVEGKFNRTFLIKVSGDIYSNMVAQEVTYQQAEHYEKEDQLLT
mmetsp:Transcript_29252/g.36327  ORF Transcript_29252/g.36327 Transcript_29252/m.36327 type:complete len:82 (-) Transcript_29252:65-310(-)